MILFIYLFFVRYDHYATLCELLPAALPSLAYCLQALREGKNNTEPLVIIIGRFLSVELCSQEGDVAKWF